MKIQIEIKSLLGYNLIKDKISEGNRAKMKRNTIQRTLVLQTVQKLQSHPTADQVYEAVAQQHPTISRGTVYRNLNQLAEDGEIKKLETPDGADHFDHCCHRHYHVRCVKCGAVYDVQMEQLPNLEQLVQDSSGFELQGFDLMFRGVCPECAKKSTGIRQNTGKPVNIIVKEI